MAASSEATSSKSDQAEAEAPAATPEVDLAQTLRELSRGEQAATSMEVSLTNLESKLDTILATFDHLEQQDGLKGTNTVDGEAEEKK